MTKPVVVQGTPVVVQGTPIPQQQQQHDSYPQPMGQVTVSDGEWHGRGEKQETKCRDPIFAVLLYAAVAAIVAVGAIYGPDALSSSSSNTGDDYSGYIVMAVILVLLSFLGAGCGLFVLMCIPETLVKVSLIFVVIMSGVWMVLSFLSGAIFAGVLGLIFFALSLCYARAVWHRIPFATANLVTACTAIRSNLGVTVYAYLLTALAGGWTVIWSLALIGTIDKTYSCNEVTNVCSNPSYGLLFLLFLAYFFVHQVLQNCIHTTVAGMVGNWWFEPSEASHCCSAAVNNSFIRTMTTSFGSICFGSFLVALLQALKALANMARQNGDGNFLVCIAECILACLASMLEYFNKWAFIYVGLYGYPYLEAGKNVFTLFRNRGWEAVIADDLVGNTLFLVSLVVGGIMGAIGVLLSLSNLTGGTEDSNEKGIAFVIGLIAGLAITSVLMSTIGSGVNAIIVLFAEAPAEFQQNYPTLSNRMRETWSQVYPGSV